MIEEQPGTAGQEHGPTRRVHRSRANRVIAGVCGGLGEYLGLDPVLLRIAFVGLALANGIGVILYIIAWIAMPQGPEGEVPSSAPPATMHQARLIVGGGLVLLGALLLLRISVPWFDARLVWSALLIAVGALIVVKGLER